MVGRFKKSRLRTKLSEVFELPEDITFDLPRVTLLGNMQMFVENHKGIIAYTDQEIRVSMDKGELIIYGEKLVLRNIQVDDIVVQGEIQGIKFSQ